MQVFLAVRRGLVWASAGIATLLGDSLSPARQARQKKRRDTKAPNESTKGPGEPGA